MTTRQPRTPQEAASLGLLMPNMPRGLFGSVGRRPRGYAGNDGSTPSVNVPPGGPPPITDAPAPPSNWQQQLGPDVLGSLPQLDAPAMPSAPPMRGGNMGQPQKMQAGMFGAVPLGTPGAPPSPAALAARAGGAMQRGSMTLGETAAGAMPQKNGIDWRMIAGIVGDALGGLNGQPPMYAQAMYKERAARADQQRQNAEIMLRSRLDREKPDYFTAGNDRVRYDPTTGGTETLYTAPEEFDTYARALGAEPGTAEYNILAQDYIMRSSGPSATANDQFLEDHRQGNRVDLENLRYGNRQGLEDQRQGNRIQLRGTPTYRQANPIPPKPRASGGGRGGSGGGVREGQTASGPNGAKIVYRNGKWVPLK
jgi:hypothetical protein